ncbi:response regulator [Holophaga foetida]|uniref:response regulator n=1 Tax=Holophaga foetida TaxID=35839 RepID=UPI0002472159|nr:response regulator [Holophaga foetida]
MPRLLLVDDNPSIHKIAESLLAHTQIELVCAESGHTALGLVESSSPFDVALIDISMAGMDGWELLDKLRSAPGTARLPIAMMAGVLDTVDPDRLAKAPIQGFLKKPVELRDLADRIQVLLDTPVPEPEPIQEPEVPTTSPFETLPAQNLSDLQARLNTDDILELTEEDLYPEEEAQPSGLPAEEPLEEELDLEELDLESLKDLSDPEDLLAPEAFSPVEPAPLQELPLDTDLITVDDLPDLEEANARTTQETPVISLEPVAEPESMEEMLESPFPEAPEEFAHEPSEEPAAAALEEVPASEASTEEAATALDLELPEESMAALEEAPIVAAPVETPEEQGSAQPPQELPTTQALVAALMADPALMGALAKAVAAQLSDKTLREVAWEIMPEIAERQKLL